MSSEGSRSRPFNLGDENINKVTGERIGSQRPTNFWMPEWTQSTAEKAIRFLDMIGFDLDPWQRFVVRQMLGLREDGKFAAREVCLLAPRQLGKSAIAEARELIGLFILGEKTIIHTAQLYDSSKECFERTKARIKACPDLVEMLERNEIKFRHGKGNEGIELATGGRILYKARGEDPIRGFSVDLIVLDEAYALNEEQMSAVSFATAARPNPQILYSSSTGLDKSDVLLKIRDRGLNKSPRLGLFEWCADSGCDLDDQEQWYKANPGLGIRLDLETVINEREQHGDKHFGRERLGLWADNKFRAVIDLDLWDSLKDAQSQIVTRYVVAVDATPSPPHQSAIAIAGFNADGKKQVEVVETYSSLSGVTEALTRLYQAKRNPPPLAVCVQGGTAAGRLIPEIQQIRDLDGNAAEVIIFSPRDATDACGYLFDSVSQRSLVHLGDQSILTALAGATKIRVGKLDGPKGEEEYRAWYWGRKDVLVNVSPLCACTYALWGLTTKQTEAELSKKHYEGKPFGGGLWLV